MGMYEDWGFSSTPFASTALPASDLGARLLVGRDDEVRKLTLLLGNPPKLPTIEGPNGIGKTSLVNVCSYRLLQQSLTSGQGPLFIPCSRAFQLDPSTNTEAFVNHVLMEVAQTLIEHAAMVSQFRDKIPNIDRLDQWLNSSHISTIQSGFQVLGFGVEGGKSTETNTSTGFSGSGLQKTIREWLREIFPTPGAGGVVCVLDNLELLQTSDAARKLIEHLRDPLLALQGLRWVLCGATGIVLTVASSPRLAGYLHSPIEVEELDQALAASVFGSRVAAYGKPGVVPYLPIRQEDFVALSALLRGNLRSTISEADNYCVSIAMAETPNSDAGKEIAFTKWLSIESKKLLKAARRVVSPRAWKAFEVAVSLGGTFSPSDFTLFDFNSSQAMRPSIKDLEQANLVISSFDEEDKRRKTIQLTSKGWMVDAALKAEEVAQPND